ncbi:hypothetical protein [Streptococcus parauberis]
MKGTGWSRLKDENTLKEFEQFNVIKFPELGGMMLKEGEVR